jgi:hypothetical protein
MVSKLRSNSNYLFIDYFILICVRQFSENRIKIYETRKEEYKKLINFFQEIFSKPLNNKDTSKITQDEKFKKAFLDMGASIAIFGSKKLYKTYCFYRWLALDEIIQKSRWYSQGMIIYSLGEMYQIMRKEIGLNHNLIPVGVPDMLAFYINDFTKPEFKKKFYRYHFNKFALQSAIIWGNIEEYIPLVWLQNYIIKPFFFLCYCIIRFPFKLLIITPIKLIMRHKKTIRINKKHH